MNIEIKRLSHNDAADLTNLVSAFETIFEMDDLSIPDQSHLTELLRKPDFLVWVAKANDTIIGGLTAYTLHRYYSIKPLIFIYDIGVLSEYQRMGIGKELIAHLRKYCLENGIEEAFVDAEADDTDALKFYRSTNIEKEAGVIQFTYSFNTTVAKE